MNDSNFKRRMGKGFRIPRGAYIGCVLCLAPAKYNRARTNPREISNSNGNRLARRSYFLKLTASC